MRIWTHLSTVVLVAFAANSSLVFGQDAPKANFEGNAEFLEAPAVATSVSQDGQTAGLLFRNVEISLEEFKEKPYVSQRVFSVETPVKYADPKNEVYVKQDLRGFAQADKGARAVVIMHSAGHTSVIDVSKNSQKGDDFFFSTTGKLAAGSDYLATFILVLEKDTNAGEAGGLIQLDSLDLSFTTQPKCKKKK